MGRKALFGTRRGVDAYGFRTVADAGSFADRLQAKGVTATQREDEIRVTGFAARQIAADEFWDATDLKDRYVISFGK